MRTLLAAAALALFTACGPTAAEAPRTGVEALAWLGGSWANEHEGEWSEEHWSAPRAGIMLGSGRSGKGDALGSFEYLRIAEDEGGTVALFASPGGGEMTRFELSESSASSATFSNPEHDFPQRIAYSRTDDTLAVEISLSDGSNAMGWELTCAD